MIPVMIVDDEKLTIEDLSTLVDWQACGYEIVAKTFNGKRGIRMFEEFHPQLILTDIRMPFMDGIRMCEEIRKKDPEVQIVLLTAYEEFEYAKAAIRLGVTDYLIKSEITEENFTVFLQEMRTRILRRRREKEFLGDSVAVSYISAGEQEDLSAADLQGTSSERFSRPVESAVSYIRRHYANPDLSMDEIAEHVRLSSGYLSANFKKEVGITVKNYITDVRIDAAKKMMDAGNYRIYEISQAVGYRSSQYFSQAFQKKTGIFPKDYRRGEDG